MLMHSSHVHQYKKQTQDRVALLTGFLQLVKSKTHDFGPFILAAVCLWLPFSVFHNLQLLTAAISIAHEKLAPPSLWHSVEVY